MSQSKSAKEMREDDALLDDLATVVDTIEETKAVDLAAQVAELQQALELEQTKSTDYWDRLLRKEADTQNLQKRFKQDVENAHKFALDGFAKELLVVLDTFERGMQAAVGDESTIIAMREGLELTHKMLLDILHKFHITPVDPKVGDAFDPTYHQAISMQPTSSVAPNLVMAVAQKGYLLHGRLLRPAQVLVSKAE